MTTKTMNPTTDAVVGRVSSLTNNDRDRNMIVRPRRLRRSAGIRALVRETNVRPDDLIYPLFVVPQSRPRVEIGSMPGVFQSRVKEAVDDARRAYDAGIRAVLLFGLPEFKDGIGSSS